MRVIPPVPITPAKLLSISVADVPMADVHTPAAYSAGTTYSYGAVVSVAADFTIYESLQDGNLANTPLSAPLWWRAIGPTETAYNAGTTYALGATVSANGRCYESLAAGNTGNPLPVLPETETTKWIDVGPTNKWAAFDLARNTQTVAASPLTVVFRPGMRVNALGLTGLQGNTLMISATSVFGGGVVYGPVSVDLNIRDVLDAYDYAFAPFSTRPSHVVFDVPPYSDIIFTVTVSATSGNVKIGSIVTGTSIYLGAVVQNAENDGLNFSSISRDLYGTATLVPRRTLPKTTQELMLPAKYVTRALAARVALNALPAMWVGMDENTSHYSEMLLILGIYLQFKIHARQAEDAVISLTLEEI